MKKLLGTLALYCAFIWSAFGADQEIGLTGTDVGYNPLPRSQFASNVALASWSDGDWNGCVPCQSPEDDPEDLKIDGKILPSLRPWSTCSDYAWVRNQIRYLTTGRYLELDGPSGLNYVTWLEPWELTRTKVPFYRNWDLGSGGGCSERGTRIACPIVLQSEVPFNPSDLNVQWYTTDGGELFSDAHYGFGNDFTDLFVGYSWGPDGIRNTSDDLEFKSGPTRPVNELYYTGVWGGTDHSLQYMSDRFNSECIFVVFHYWLESDGITRFDQEVKVPLGYTFPGWVEIAPSRYSDWVNVGIDPGGMRGFLYQSQNLYDWSLVDVEPYEPGWYYIKAPPGKQVFFRLWPDIYYSSTVIGTGE